MSKNERQQLEEKAAKTRERFEEAKVILLDYEETGPARYEGDVDQYDETLRLIHSVLEESRQEFAQATLRVHVFPRTIKEATKGTQ